MDSQGVFPYNLAPDFTRPASAAGDVCPLE